MKGLSKKDTPYVFAISAVRSVLPESTTTISSAIPASEVKARGRLCSSLNVIRQAERRFIGLRAILESALVSHKANRRNWSTDKAALRRRETTLLRLEIHANQAATDSKLGTVPQHGRAHAFFVEESAVGRIHVLEIAVRFSHFQKAVMPRNFRIIQRDVRTFTAEHDTRLCERVALAFRRSR